MIKINLDLDRRGYPIYISDGFEEFGEAVLSLKTGRKAMVITDSNVGPHYLPAVISILKEKGLDAESFTIPAGETSKNLETIKSIYEACLNHKLDRNSVIFALGGGVVGDIAGFAAATYMRGIPFVQIPTTTIAQADSSVGGKVGVDFQGAKNLIGSFFQPRAVYINVETLKTLPDREYISGLAETIKHGIIYDEEFFMYLEEQMDRILAKDTQSLMYMAKMNCQIKGDVVEKDEFESDLRAILNFGHTIGHAIESASDFSLTHGECVSIGMVGETMIAEKLGFCDEGLTERIVGLLERTGLPVKAPGIDMQKVKKLMSFDKKIIGGKMKFVLPRKIGQVIICDEVDEKAIDAALAELLI